MRSSGYLYRAVCDTCGSEGSYATKDIKAAKAWNTRAEYHGFEQAAIESWENIKAWNRRHVETCHNTDDDPMYFCCSKCGSTCTVEYGDGGYGRPSFCPSCGRKVET